MELALNLIWLALAISGVLLLFRELSRAPLHPARQHSRRQKILAMTCALIILFFVVSMTDDLHDQEIFVEESRFQRVVAGVGAASLAHASHISPSLFLAFVSYPSLPLALPFTICPIERTGPLSRTSTLPRALSGRAPPFVS